MHFVLFYDPATPTVQNWRDVPDEPFKGHLALMSRLFAEGHLQLGGGFADLPDGSPLGMVVVEAESERQVWEWIEQDPLYLRQIVRPRLCRFERVLPPPPSGR